MKPSAILFSTGAAIVGLTTVSHPSVAQPVSVITPSVSGPEIALDTTVVSTSISPNDKLDLGIAIAHAFAVDPTLRADQEGLKILDEDASAARAATRPNILAEASGTRSELDVRGTGYVAGLRFQQALYRGGRVQANIRAADANVMAGRQSLRRSEMDLIREVAESYSAVLRDREVLRIRAEFVRNLERLNEAQMRSGELGEQIMPEIARVQAQLAAGRADFERSRAQLRSSELAFTRATGLLPGPLEPLPPAPPTPQSGDEAVDQALENSPEVLQTRWALKVAENQQRGAEANRLPNLDFNGTVQHRNEVVQFLDREFEQTLGTFVLTLTAPIYQGGAEFSAIRRAKNVVTLRKFEIVEAENAMETNVRTAFSQLQTSRRALEAEQLSVSANDSALGGLRRIVELGEGTVSNLLDVELEALSGRVGLAQERHQSFVAAITLLAEIGVLNPETLGAEVTPYDPNQHFRRAIRQWAGTTP